MGKGRERREEYSYQSKVKPELWCGQKHHSETQAVKTAVEASPPGQL